MNGILLIDKPNEWTSHDVVAKVRGIVKKETGIKKPKVGHAGTLDPLATGLLVVLVGSYCKRAQEFTKLDKVYDVELKLGEVSTTDDEEGEKTAISDKIPSEKEAIDTINSFIGEIEQVPPIYSAIKVDGKRAYKEARKGNEVKLRPRKVTIYSITDVSYDYPYVRFTAKVSSGTYIRSLTRDIGEKLGTGAYMSNLRRTDVGDLSVVDANSIDSLTKSINLLQK
jgi:tRNA pseudouridine55 synthase